MAGRPWIRSELFEALRLYGVTPFGKIHSRNPDIIALAMAIKRTPSAVALKMVNFASLDPTIEQVGMSNASKLDREVWNEFFEQLVDVKTEDEHVGFSETEAPPFDYLDLPGLSVKALISRRINQDYFRRLVLTAYDARCAATGVDAPELLVAGHIVPWSDNQSLRTNPSNGICLNNLFDKAFDRGLVAIGENLEILYSQRLPAETMRIMKSIAFDKIRLPSRFRPNIQFFEYHRTTYFV